MRLLVFLVLLQSKVLFSHSLAHFLGWDEKGEKAFYAFFEAVKLKVEGWGSDFSEQTDERKFEIILEFLEKTQITLGRKPGQERWQMEPIAFSENQPWENWLKDMGFIHEVTPKQDPAVVAILGATRRVMQRRLSVAVPKPELLVLLSGERYVTEGVDGTRDELEDLAKRLGKTFQELTEMDLLGEAYFQSPWNQEPLNHVPVQKVNTPKGALSRPTTETTLQDFLRFVQPKGHMVFVSSQPYVKTQGAIVENILKSSQPSVTFETIGYPITFSEDSFAKSKELRSCSEALAGFIWAKIPLILEGLTFKPSQKLKERIFSFYASSSFLYPKLQSIFS